MRNRFDLEQDIMACWHITDDIRLLREYIDAEEATPDQLDNFLLGMQVIYEVKFQRLFATFEQCLRTGEV